MRLLALLPFGWLAGLGAAVAAPPGYHAPRRYYTSRNLAYVRPGVRLHLSGNLAYYSGDVTSRFQDNTFRAGYGIGLTHALSPRVTLSTEVSLVRLQAKDQFPDRGFSFESNNGLLTGTVRYNLLEDKSLYLGSHYAPSAGQLFVEAGAGLMLTSPTSYQNVGGGSVRQLPDDTRAGYPLLLAAFPVGVGGTLRASNHLYFTLNALYYFTTTDLLDNISKLANPNSADNFATLSLKVEFAFGKGKGHPLTHEN